jgi:hypothetical protein
MGAKMFGGGDKSGFANVLEKSIKKGFEKLTEAAALFPIVNG